MKDSESRIVPSTHDLETVVRFLKYVFQLKDIVRQGWNYEYIDADGVARQRQVDNPESDGDHKFGLAIGVLTLGLLYRLPMDVIFRAMILAIIHDLPELIVGDTVTATKVGQDFIAVRRQKEIAETVAMQHICYDHLPRDIADFFMEAWQEYEAGITEAAKLVKSLDKIDFTLQSINYLEQDCNVSPERYLGNAVNKLTHEATFGIPDILSEMIAEVREKQYGVID